MECEVDRNLEKCNCTYSGCPRKGKCCECIAYHRKNGELPACYFTEEQEKTWDRTIEHFVRINSKR
ncbi:hypothetical protein RM69_00240 [Mesotoga sp. SC_NapDC3]|nr:hypothetical protein RM69_00240 [Mesotoga sp. SC_NapDC3]PXF35620.1 hypothetical protein EU77_00620 [Mesotoga sp. SC_NapDC]